MEHATLYLSSFIFASIIFFSCENGDEKVYKSVLSKYDVMMSEFNAAQSIEALNSTTEKLSVFKNGQLKQEYDSLCTIDKVPKSIQKLVNEKEKEVSMAQSEAHSRIN